MTVFDNPALESAVAKFLFIASKEEPDGVSGIYRAAALALLGKPVSAGLLCEAAKHETVDDPLYTREIADAAMLDEIWAASARHEKG